MRILIESGTFDYQNMGDLAMLQVAIAQLRELWPGADLYVISGDSAELQRQCPGVKSVPVEGRDLWFQERYFLGGLHGRMPGMLSRAIIAQRMRMANAFPRATLQLMRARAVKSPVARGQLAKAEEFVKIATSADLMLVVGSATVNDLFHVHARRVLRTLDFALRNGAAAAMLGQGFGPLSNPGLLAELAQLVPRLELIGLREPIYGTELLSRMKVTPERVLVTGDEALAMPGATEAREIGQGIGVNLRVAKHSGVDESTIPMFAGVLGDLARELGARLVPIPIALHKYSRDQEVLERILRHAQVGPSPDQVVRSPAEVLERIGGCRLVITGAYHAAVFALSRGIPVITLEHSSNDYYGIKFEGLRRLFGEGCCSLKVDSPDFVPALRAKVVAVWNDPLGYRASLRRATLAQVQCVKEAYKTLKERVRPRAQ